MTIWSDGRVGELKRRMMPGLGKFHRAYSPYILGPKDEIGANSIILYHHLDATVGMQMIIMVA
jgi:hypothetical protein